MDGAWKEILKKICKKIFCLPPVQTLLIAVPSYLFVIYVLSGGTMHQGAAYIAYLLSAYAFMITITGISGIAGWFALAGIISFAVHKNSSFTYPGLFIYVMAVYTLYAAITAVINVVKFRKYKSPILSAAKVVNLTAALVSVPQNSYTRVPNDWPAYCHNLHR